MKLKLVVASMSACLIGCPVFAATQTTQTTTSTEAAAPAMAAAPVAVKHHHHHHVHHVHHHMAQTHEYNDYKDAGALPVVAVIDTHQMIYDAMSQNVGRSKGMPDWFNRITLSGGIAADGHWGNRSQGYMGENYTRVSLNDAYLNATANVNDWTKALISLSYSNFSGTNGAFGGTYSNAYTNNQINLEQGYVTIANYDVSPFFFQVGKQFTDYGRYTIHPLERSFTQVMTESLQTSAKLGFITGNGFHGDIYAFSNPSIQLTRNHSNTVYGAGLGYDMLNEQLGFDLGIGYMSDLTGVNDIQGMIGNTAFGAHNYVHLVGGIAAYADLNSGPFTVGIRYTSAIQRFNPNDLSNVLGTAAASGARPWTGDILAGFAFNNWLMNKSQNVYVGYERSGNAVNLALPRYRYLAGYNVDMWKNTNIGIELGHDQAYGRGHGANNNGSNTVGLRGAVKFG